MLTVRLKCALLHTSHFVICWLLHSFLYSYINWITLREGGKLVEGSKFSRSNYRQAP